MKTQLAATFLGTMFFCACSNVKSTSFVDRDIAELRSSAVAAFEGRVSSLSASCGLEGCASYVTAEVQKAYFGEGAVGKKMRFCSLAPLMAGYVYVFFVEAEKSENSKCELISQRDGIFSRFGESVYRYMSPGSFTHTEIDGDEYLTGWIIVKDFDLHLAPHEINTSKPAAVDDRL